MKTKTVKRWIGLMVVGLATLFLWSPFWTSSEITATLLYRTDSWEEANRLGTAKSLTLIDYDGRIAVFAYEGNDIRRYLDAGFVFDSTLKTDGPPWSKPIVDDPYFSKQYAIALTNTDDAWNVTKGSIDVTVAIIDTGIDTNHPEFFGRLSELSFNAPFNQIGLTYVEDDYGHGTMVAGIIGANINNATGIAGLTNDVSLLIIKANQPGQETFKDSDIIRSIYYAVDHGANIINLSLGGTYANPLTEEAVRYAVSNNVLVIASSGNDGENIAMYPASFDQVISVGSVDSSSKRSLFSNYHERLDLVAPGTDIYTTAVDGKYTVVSGTSFSAPHVSGIAALYRSVYPDIDAMLLKMALESSARDLGETGFDWYYGHGLVDANKLLSIRYRIVTTHFPEGGSETYVVQDGLTVDLNPPPPYPNHEFVGWYLDAALSVSFDPRLPIQSDVDLYAAYGRTHVIVTWVIHENVFQTEVVPMGETPRIPEPMQTGMTFVGWFKDPAYAISVDVFLASVDQTYYGYFETSTFEICFLTEDMQTIWSRTFYNEEESPIFPEGPAKPQDERFVYQFVGWSDIELFSKDTVFAYPLYRKTLIADLAGLNPSVDTIRQGEAYVDASAFLIADGIEMRTVGQVDSSVLGIQSVRYEFYDGEVLVYVLIRNVHVVMIEPLLVELNKGIATLWVGDIYQEAGVSHNRGTVTIEGIVDTSRAGIYVVTYRVEDGLQVVRMNRYVMVVDPKAEWTVVWFAVRKEESDDGC